MQKKFLFAVWAVVLCLTWAEPLITTTSIWLNPVFRSVLAESKSVKMALQASGPLSAVEFMPFTEDCKIIESFRFHESREYMMEPSQVKLSKYGIAWTSPLGVSVNLLSDQLFSIDFKRLPGALTQALYDGVYLARKKRVVLIDKGILYWRGRTFPLQVELDPSKSDSDIVHIIGEKDLFGRPIQWATTWSSPTLNFYPIKWINSEDLSRKQKPFLTLSKLPEYRISWSIGTKIVENEQHFQRFYDRIAHLLEVDELDLVADYIGYENITVLRNNWKETFKSPRSLKWRMRSIFTKKIVATILDQKNKTVIADEQGIQFGNGEVVIKPTTNNAFEMIISP
jgi:hypothetical protein